MQNVCSYLTSKKNRSLHIPPDAANVHPPFVSDNFVHAFMRKHFLSNSLASNESKLVSCIVDMDSQFVTNSLSIFNLYPN